MTRFRGGPDHKVRPVPENDPNNLAEWLQRETDEEIARRRSENRLRWGIALLFLATFVVAGFRLWQGA